MSGYRAYTVSTTTWADRMELVAIQAPWARAKNGSAGTFRAQFHLTDPTHAAIANSGALAPIERCMVIEYEGVVVYAGIIWESTYLADTQSLTIAYEDIWSLWDLRLISENRTSAITGWKKTYSGMEYDTIIKRLVQLGTAGSGRIIPMVYEDDYSGGRSRTYYGYNVDTVLDAISEIMDLENGPDVDFRPEWESDGSLRWTLRTGDLSLNTIEVHYSAADSAAKGLRRDISGQERATQMFAVGEGTGGDMKVAVAGGTGAFSLERIEQAKNIKTQTELAGFAAAEMAPRRTPITQYSMDLSISSPIIGNLWEIRPGTLVRWYIQDDPAISTGWRTNAVLEYSGDTTTEWLRIEFQ